MVKDSLNSPAVRAVEEFRKAIVASMKALAQKQQKQPWPAVPSASSEPLVKRVRNFP
jgi:hypothetical protein